MSFSLGGTAKSLLRNRLQASLTLVGMSVGVAMVVIVSGLGLGAHQKIEAQLQSAGPTLITIQSGNYMPGPATRSGEDGGGGEVGQGGGALSLGDSGTVSDVTGNNPNVQAVRTEAKMSRYHSPATPLTDAELSMLAGLPDVTAIAASLDGNVSLASNADTIMKVVHVNGFQSDWPDLQGWKLSAGRWPTPAEQSAGAAVALLPDGASTRLWPDAPTPIGKTVQFNGLGVQVVGTFSGHDDAAGAIIPQVYVDLPEARKLLGREDYDSITVRASAVDVMSALAMKISAKMRELHKLPADTFDDFLVQTQAGSAMRGLGTSPTTFRSGHANMF